MAVINQIKDILKTSSGIITSKQLKALNIPTVYLTRLVEKGELTRVDRGIYIDSTGDYDEFFFFQTRYSTAIYSYVTSLYFHNLTEIIPHELEITVYKGYNANRMPDNTRIHYVTKDIYDLGVTVLETPYGNKIKAYDLERTICDLIKNRDEVDSELFSKTINFYTRLDYKDLYKLHEYSKKMKIYDKVNDLMELFT